MASLAMGPLATVPLAAAPWALRATGGFSGHGACVIFCTSKWGLPGQKTIPPTQFAADNCGAPGASRARRLQTSDTASLPKTADLKSRQHAPHQQPGLATGPPA